jgi:hypothetical protein
MNTELKKQLLETLYYHLGILSTLKKNAKRYNEKSFQEYSIECEKVGRLIKQVKDLNLSVDKDNDR